GRFFILTKKATHRLLFLLYSIKEIYFFLFASLIYFSKAMVMEGVSGVGAAMSTRNPFSSAALMVVFPKTAIRVSFCLKSGKLWNKESIPEGLKNTKIS